MHDDSKQPKIFTLQNIIRTYKMVNTKKVERITVSLPVDDHARLSVLADECDASLSWVARQAIADFLKRHEAGDVQLPLNLPKPRGAAND